MKKKQSNSSILEHSAGDLGSPILSPRRQKNGDTLQFMLRVINSSFVFSTLTLPFYFQMSGIILGPIICVIFFLLSWKQSELLLEMKYYARSKKKQGTLTQLFELFQIPKYVSDIYRGIMIVNAYLYVVLLMNVFQSSIQSLIYLMAKPNALQQNSWAQALASQQFIQFIGSLLMIPFFIKWTYPSLLVAFARILGVFSMMFIIIAAFISEQKLSQEDDIQIIKPSINTLLQSFISAPTILMAFAYHSQFFTGRKLEKNDDDTEKRMWWGAFYGSMCILLIELTLSILAAVAFNQVNQNLDSLYGNLIRMVYQSYEQNQQNIQAGMQQYINLHQAYYYIFYIFIAISAQLQIVQYIPYVTVLILNILDKKPKITKNQSLEFMLITDGELFRQEEEKETKKNSSALKNKFRQSLAMHSEQKIKQNQQFSLYVTIGVYFCAFLFAMAKPPILMLSCLMGSTTQNFMTFLIPSILYLDKQFKEEKSEFKKCFAWFMIIFSSSFAAVSISLGLYGLYTDQI